MWVWINGLCTCRSSRESGDETGDSPYVRLTSPVVGFIGTSLIFGRPRNPSKALDGYRLSPSFVPTWACAREQQGGREISASTLGIQAPEIQRGPGDVTRKGQVQRPKLSESCVQHTYLPKCRPACPSNLSFEYRSVLYMFSRRPAGDGY